MVIFYTLKRIHDYWTILQCIVKPEKSERWNLNLEILVSMEITAQTSQLYVQKTVIILWFFKFKWLMRNEAVCHGY